MAKAADEVLHELIERCKVLQLENANEAKTRLEVINTVLEDVLGWPRQQFNPETLAPAANGTKQREWLDYHLTPQEGTALVVEAKRIGNTFSFARTKKTQRYYKLQTLRSAHGAPMTAALAQASKYCISTGTFAFAVTNGVQWIAGVSAWPRVPADKLEAVVFYDLEDVLTNLPDFVDLLSPEGLASGNLLVRAVQTRGLSPVSAASLNTKIPHNPPPPRSANYLAGPIETLMRLCFDELNGKDEEMLRRCYVRNDLTDGYVARLETFVGQTLSYDLDPKSTKPLVRSRFARNPAEDAFTKAISADGDGAALLLVGRLGTGKSTFIEYATIRLRETHLSKALVILRLDLRNKTQLAALQFEHDKLRTEIAVSLLEQAQSAYPDLNPFEYANLKGIFSPEIQRELAATPPTLRDKPEADERLHTLISGLRADAFLHLRRYLSYLRTNRRIPVAVVFDNIDRGTPQFERAVFAIARSLSDEAGITTITSLRDTTFHNEKTLGFLDVSQPVAFTLTAPPLVSVLAKRLDYVKNRVLADEPTAKRLLRSMEGFSIETVRGFIEAMSEIVGSPSSEIAECIQHLSATDVRRCLELLRAFCTSTNTDIEKLMKDFNRGYFKQTLTMFLRSIMCADVTRYVEQNSYVYNVFQVSANYIESHFLSLRILQYLDALQKDERSDTDVPAKQVVATLSSLGFLPDTVRTALNRMGEKRLLLSRSHPEPPWDDSATVRLGGSGKYYLELLIYEREYIRNVADDTIVYDPNISESLVAFHEDRSAQWPLRQEGKMRVFLDYLLRAEKKELVLVPDARARVPWCKPVMPTVGERLFGSNFVREQKARRRSSSAPPKA